MDARRVGGIVFALGIATRLAVVASDPGRWSGPLDHNEIGKVALSLATAGTFADPFLTATGATAHVAPVYPFVVAAGLTIFGDSSFGRLFPHILNAVFAALVPALLPAVADAARLGRLVGVLAGVPLALFPFFVSVELSLFEAPLAALLGVLVTWRTIAAMHASASAAKGLSLGSLSGLAVLTAPQFGLVVACFAGGLWLHWRRDAKRTAAIALFLAAGAIIVVPWCVRNYFATGTVGLVRGNLGLELAISNNNEASPFLYVNWERSLMHVRHPFLNPAESLLVGQLGEARYNEQRLSEMLTWAGERPLAFGSLTLRRIWHFWVFPGDSPLNLTILYYPIVALAALGALRMWRELRPTAWPLLTFLAVFPLPYYLVQLDGRYRYPMIWVLSIAAAAGLSSLLGPSSIETKRSQ